ncbi:MAG TPA: hypothetical protein VFX28_21600 [Methylomirabilota bacterium]|nr:hypothetical protein [Methylomirabilota bacterium]
MSGLLRLARTPALAVAAAAGAYWLGLRPWHLRWGATDAEVARRWPGDELVVRPYARAVRAVTVAAPAERVWRWVMQVGRDRGGFYSYTWLENLIGADIHNVYRPIPGLAERQPGDTVWMGPPDRFGGMARMVVAGVVPGRAMTLVPPGDAERAAREGVATGVWSFALEPAAGDATRLVMLSLAARPRVADLLFWEPAHFVMERKMMLTIKRLAEAGAAS